MIRMAARQADGTVEGLGQHHAHQRMGQRQAGQSQKQRCALLDTRMQAIRPADDDGDIAAVVDGTTKQCQRPVTMVYGVVAGREGDLPD